MSKTITSELMDKLIEIYNNWYKIEREIKRAKEGREKQERKKPTKQHPIIRLFENKKKQVATSQCIHFKLMKQ